VHGLLQGERPDRAQVLGFALALGGLLVLLLPGASAPDLKGALLMLLAGVAWGFYSLLGRGTREPLAASSGNFLRTLPFVAALLLAYWPQLQGSGLGVLYAVLSGALTSGLGYFIWYSALPGLSAFQAASVQLSVPILAALAGSLLLAEAISLRLLLAALAVLGGIGLILRARVSKV
jgi:drug/metabolite transporter (DMT)-like permease